MRSKLIRRALWPLWPTLRKSASWATTHFGALRRWLGVLSWGGVFGFGLVFLPHLRRLFVRLLTHVDPVTKIQNGLLDPSAATAMFWVTWWALVAWLVHGLLGVRRAHFQHWRRHPPLALVGIVAILASLAFKGVRSAITWPHGFPWASLGHLAIFTAILFLPLPVLAWWRESAKGKARLSPPSPPRPSNGNLATMDAEDLVAWLQREEPLTDDQGDLFDFAKRAPGLLGVLRGERRQTVGITGPFGSGKTSLVNVIEKLAEQTKDEGPRLWFAKVNCWGFKDPTAAQEAVLKQVVATVREQVDVWGLRSLPEEYVRSISSASKAVDVALAFLRPDPEPAAQLRRLTPVLKAVGARLVVVIEDIDRNDAGFGVSHIQALLYRLRDVEGLSFILSARTGADIDFTKLCDRQVELFPLGHDVVLKVVEKLHARCLDRFPQDIHLVHPPNFFPREPWQLTTSHSYAYWFSALPAVFETPRSLKATLRRTVDAWERLHGEVDLNELFICSALRSAAPAAFDFLRANFAALGDVRTPTRSPTAASRADAILTVLQGEWKRVSATPGFQTDAAARLLRALLPASEPVFGEGLMPGSFGVQGKQVCVHREPTNYWERLLAEDLKEGEITDQSILHAIAKAQASPEALRELATQLLASEDYSARFAFFADRLEKARLLELCSTFYGVVRDRLGRQASREVPGFRRLLWSLDGRYSAILERDMEEWVTREIERSLPRHVRFASDLQGAWFREDVVNARGPVRRVRARAKRALKTALRATDAPSLCDCLGDDLLDLAHLLALITRPKAIDRGVVTPNRWAWLRPHLVAASHTCPEQFLPQLAVVLEHLPEGTTGVPSDFAFDALRLEALLGDSRDEVLTLFAEHFPSRDAVTEPYFKDRAALVPMRAKALLVQVQRSI